MADVFLGQAIRDRRLQLCFSLNGLAPLADLSSQKLSDIERGKRSCGAIVLARIAKALCSMSVFLKLRAEMASGRCDYFYKDRKPEFLRLIDESELKLQKNRKMKRKE